MKEYIDKIAKMFSKETEPKRKTQNLVFLVILLVIVLVSLNYIFKDNSIIPTNSKNANNDTKNTENENKLASPNYNGSMEESLTKILENIAGISEVSVMLTYSKTSTTIPVYDVKEDVSVEKNGASQGDKTSTKTVTEKKVAYEERDGDKVAIVESSANPVVEGAIIVARGVSDVELTNRIKQAVASVTNIPIYKVQVFEK